MIFSPHFSLHVLTLLLFHLFVFRAHCNFCENYRLDVLASFFPARQNLLIKNTEYCSCTHVQMKMEDIRCIRRIYLLKITCPLSRGYSLNSRYPLTKGGFETSRSPSSFRNRRSLLACARNRGKQSCAALPRCRLHPVAGQSYPGDQLSPEALFFQATHGLAWVCVYVFLFPGKIRVHRQVKMLLP